MSSWIRKIVEPSTRSHWTTWVVRWTSHYFSNKLNLYLGEFFASHPNCILCLIMWQTLFILFKEMPESSKTLCSVPCRSSRSRASVVLAVQCWKICLLTTINLVAQTCDETWSPRFVHRDPAQVNGINDWLIDWFFIFTFCYFYQLWKYENKCWFRIVFLLLRYW